MFKKCTFAVVALTFSLFTFCDLVEEEGSININPDVLGTWEGVLPSTNQSLTFDEDGTFWGSYIDNTESGLALFDIDVDITGEFTATELIYTFTYAAGSVDEHRSSYVVENDTLKLENSDNEYDTFRRSR